MIAALALITALAALTLAAIGLHRQADHRREMLERFNAVSDAQRATDDRMAAQDGKLDVLASDWSSAFASVEQGWARHIERVEDTVSTRLSFQHSKPRSNR